MCALNRLFVETKLMDALKSAPAIAYLGHRAYIYVLARYFRHTITNLHAYALGYLAAFRLTTSAASYPYQRLVLRIILVSLAFGYLLSMLFVSECTYINLSCATHMYVMCICVWMLLLLQSFAKQLSDCATICMIIVCIAYCYSCWFYCCCHYVVVLLTLWS